MEWSQQFEIIAGIAKRKFAESGETFTLKGLEVKLGLSQGKTHHWKKGQKPHADDLAMLAKVFGIEPRWLLLGEGHPEGDPAPHCVSDPIAQRVDQVARAMRDAGVDEMKILAAARDMLEGEMAKLAKERGGYGVAEAHPGMPRAAEEPACYTDPKKAAGTDTV